ncbi:putative ankyrin repeat protein RF_0381 [Cloeon dipterum]|uniref:putative ankyrin repeat protein RF_0381 n=1 Tax=Cloeon dipterum TaxID=197152 RepID=UPI00322079E0
MADDLLEFLQDCSLEECQNYLKEKDINVSTILGPCCETLMHYAARNINHGCEIVKFLASEELDVAKKDSKGKEPIHYATEVKNFKVAEQLLKLRRVEDEEEQRNNLLHVFVKENNFILAKIVHDHHKNMIKERGEYGKTALHLAAQHADLKGCHWLVENGVEIGAFDEKLGATALHYVAFRASDHKIFVCYLVEHADLYVSEKAKGKMTPLHYALQQGKHEMAMELFRLGAETRIKMGTVANVLHFCVKNNDLEGAKLVHRKDKKMVHESNKSGTTAFHHAAMHADLEMLQWLAKRDVNKYAVDDDLYRANALHFIAYNTTNADNETERRQMVRYLIGLDMDRNKVTGDGQAPIHFALRLRNLVVADELIKQEVDLTVEFQGLNLLQFCIKENYLEGAKLVFKHKPKQIKARDSKGRNAAHIAAEYADVDMCQWLFLLDEDVFKFYMKTGASPLHMAAKNKKHGVEIVQYLIKLKVPLNSGNEFELSPLHFALLNRNLDTARELVNLGAKADVRLLGEKINLMHFCVRHNCLEGAKYVHSLNPELINELGLQEKSVLHLAAEYADVEMCKWLVKQGVDPMALTSKGKSVMDIASKRCCYDMKLYFKTLNVKKRRGLLRRLIRLH